MRVTLSYLRTTSLFLALVAFQPLLAAEDMWEGVFVYQKKMADYGNPEAQVKLGQMYEEGHGVAQDFVEARHWYEKAAAKGYVPAREQITKLDARQQQLIEEEEQRKLAEEHRKAQEVEASREAEQHARKADKVLPSKEAERPVRRTEKQRLKKEVVDREVVAQEREEARQRAEEAKQKMLATPEPF